MKYSAIYFYICMGIIAFGTGFLALLAWFPPMVALEMESGFMIGVAIGCFLVVIIRFWWFANHISNGGHDGN